MLFTLAVSVSAADPTGTITIDNAVVGQTYTIYEILYLESYNKDAGAYSYKATADWNAFINSDAIKDVYVNVDKQGYVTWKDNVDPAAFAKLAQKYAVDNKIDNQGTKAADATTVTFDKLNLGYYLVDTTLGTLCSLDTTNPDVTIKEKNAEPTNVKTVEEDSTGNYGGENDADIGQNVNFKSTITVQDTYDKTTGIIEVKNYVFHDTMSAGLTYTGVTGVTLNGNTVAASNYEVVTTGLTDGCTFEVKFTPAFCNTLKANDQIVISYTATVNENAVIGSTGNPNESKISYGENGKYESTPSVTKTYTWSFDVVKYTMKDGAEVTLAGAKFVLSKNTDGSNLIALVDEGNNVYRVATDKDQTTITEITTDNTGSFTIKGLDSDTYYLKETKAPEGYNTLKDSIEVVIGSDGKINVTEENANGVNAIRVENKTGTELPSTGGIGTTIFYILGTVLALGTAVVLVTKVRMKKDQ